MNRRSLLKTLAALPLLGLAPKPQRKTRIAFVRAEVPLSKEWSEIVGLTAAESAMIEKAAASKDAKPVAWARDVLLRTAKRVR